MDAVDAAVAAAGAAVDAESADADVADVDAADVDSEDVGAADAAAAEGAVGAAGAKRERPRRYGSLPTEAAEERFGRDGYQNMIPFV